MFLARKITYGKWRRQNCIAGSAPDEITADTITSDLRTSENSLSFWRCGTATNTEIRDVALNIASMSNQTGVITIVWINEDDLTRDGHAIKNSKGRTKIRDLKHNHIDVYDLDYKRLGQIAGHVYGAFENKQYTKFGKSEVNQLISQAISQDRLKYSDLNPKIQKSLHHLDRNGRQRRWWPRQWQSRHSAG